ncbi:MAG: hypothetical protein AAFY46_02010, partial [Planctomycetota bacterium]
MKTAAAIAFAAAATHATAETSPPRGLLAPVAPIAAAVPAPQILGSPSVADDTFIKARGGGWILFQSGSVQVGDPSGGGTSILDLEDTLNQDSTDVSPIGSLAVAIPAIDI